MSELPKAGPATAPPPSPPPSREDWSHVFALLDVALELPAAERAPWLAALPAAQAHLAPLLHTLLQTHAGFAAGGSDSGDSGVIDVIDVIDASHARDASDAGYGGPDPNRANRFMHTPAAFVLDGAPQAAVGPYRLLREIGQGGMASVWLAERADGLLQRHVALKLPHISTHPHALAARMARERSILASLTHPHIARLYDAGVTPEGRPYLASRKSASDFCSVQAPP